MHICMSLILFLINHDCPIFSFSEVGNPTSCPFFEREKNILRHTKLIPVAPDDILRSYEAKHLVRDINELLEFNSLFP